MDELVTFLRDYGLPLTLIAIAGIVVLGVLKYCNLFKKVDESKRHYIYLAISVGLSVIATIVYLLIVKQFTAEYVVVVACAIYALNQTFYNIFKITPINDLARKVLDFLVSIFKKKTDGGGGTGDGSGEDSAAADDVNDEEGGGNA